ncbi:MAG TPA: serine hydrolase domain-containing protein [Nevskia sp.]|nr:serine hydrolase domain-containing protein [Nevskia sp.]
MSSGGFSQARWRRMHEVMARHTEEGKVPGLVALVSRRGETRVEHAGVLATDGAPVRRDSIFRISSMSKPVTAVAALILLEECRLRLDEPVDRLLPELANRRVLQRLDGPLDQTLPAQRPISVRDLLTFRMGFGQMMAMPDAVPILKAANELQLGMGPPSPSNMPAPDEWLRRLGSLPLMLQPGERWMYNTGSDVLGVLIARASGQSFEDFLRQRIFEPLGMKDTAFSVPADKLERFATAYWINYLNGKDEVYDPARGGQWSRPPAFASGAGGLVSTADDFLAFSQMLLNRGRLGSVRILSRPSVEAMITDQLTPEQKLVPRWVEGGFDGRGWGFGVGMSTRRDEIAGSVGSYGWDGGLGTVWRNDPQEEMSCILLTQRAWTSPVPPTISSDFLSLAYQAIDD